MMAEMHGCVSTIVLEIHCQNRVGEGDTWRAVGRMSWQAD
jgi:hypothetical protein